MVLIQYILQDICHFVQYNMSCLRHFVMVENIYTTVKFMALSAFWLFFFLRSIQSIASVQDDAPYWHSPPSLVWQWTQWPVMKQALSFITEKKALCHKKQAPMCRSKDFKKLKQATDLYIFFSVVGSSWAGSNTRSIFYQCSKLEQLVPATGPGSRKRYNCHRSMPS